ncbi:glucose dehydrogenase [Salipiger aestuarii]|uniref:Quinoprotein glucose dehydrogenase n=1 Tax=Salipiger aestuarii TaxID=568098 RepID=A0A327Y6W8_9RHOB|nr:pyrroloquinoline quinone-dependent dehydrogenase [Salipiger aestuarii]EIE50036.1 Quinoprotein glucose dehydrogenase precursor [Citreicella sp. 357]KAB2540675.1 glucose dehydrogenase [Salipiger aestuarii]RAK15485.1 quinoprotein glucose dehydrogenase [Salipiger aestuarii]
MTQSYTRSISALALGAALAVSPLASVAQDTGVTPEQAPATPDAPVITPDETAPPAPAEQTAPDAAPGASADETAPDAPPEAPPEAADDSAQAPAEDPLAAAPYPANTPREVGADWPTWGGDERAQRYSPLDQITPENVAQLERAWVYHTGDLPSGETEGKYSPENTPLKVGDDLLMCTAMNILISVDARTGEENWRYNPDVPAEAIPYGATCRGVSVWTDPAKAEGDACATRVIEATIDARLIAVDTETGEPCADFGDNGNVDLWEGIGEKVPGWYAVTAPPAIVRGVVVTGAQVKDGQAEDAPSGVVRGYDARSGDMVWAWDLAAPDEMRNGPPEGRTYTRGTPNMWTTATGDEDLGLVYLPLGNSSVDYYGSNRSDAENEYATSLVALDATTGEERWKFQTVRHDVWDYDLGSQASLLDYRGTPAVLLASKQGDVYILNRETGEPLTPVGEITGVPQGDIEPDFIADSQPVSDFFSIRKPDLTEQDMWGFTPIDQLFCRIRFRMAQYDGYLTPPSTDWYIQYPGYNGGNDWGSVAIDPERKLMVMNYNDVPNYNRLVPREDADAAGWRPINESGNEGSGGAEGAGDPQTGAPYAIQVNAGWQSELTGMPCTSPPYGGITAVDLETGEQVWDTPLGTARRNGPFGIPSMLPIKIGTPNNGGSVITRGGLIFIGAATDNLFRAIDMETGETLWSDAMDQGGQANPISYEVDGVQYVVIGPGGHHFMRAPVGDALIAYKLPSGS